MMKKIYRVIENEAVVAIFNSKKYAKDFIDYQATISETEFEIEEVSLADWLLQPREFQIKAAIKKIAAFFVKFIFLTMLLL